MKRWKKWLIAAILSAGTANAQIQTPKGKTPEQAAKIGEMTALMGPGAAEGTQAPDFKLKLLKAYDLEKDKDGKTPEEIRLSDYRGKKPVVLIFGSYT